ncbi:amidohydrolase/deacetylase family metallohydrolase [Nonomuraea sp. KC401]|uniref:amidohydrolase/deacetylase family metallohydrolase n=1 Tax=unclassified Nonomuraea TaxID=2593643 RepID=UPI0010FEEB5C|nr:MULTISPECIES: amidohydrolase/deacetylase family metallohydrolase [unclassified Nonomuraea]NBE92580.1 amidohydrolase/deacetylase family metallohydrolase [Nonomuraea sp. K271]TLF79776.1 amidohydrolase/deacetylase family metallohydrolase [Nonomuraea sp. KC401]
MIPAVLDTPLRVLAPPPAIGGTGRLTLVNDRAHLTRAQPAAPPQAGGGTATAPDLGGELYIGPGWVDLHAHVYDAMTQISVAPDRAGLDAGVHVVADAGSAGQATIDGLVRYVIPAAGTQVRAWLNIGSHGLVHLRETADPAFIDVDATLAAIDRHRDVVCGVKVRSSGAIVGAMGLQPLQLGRLVAREAGLPLLVHVGEAPPLIGDVLDLLDAGDVVTHCYHAKTGAPWLAGGAPAPALARALDRGVLLDVGHGAASFGFGVAARALAAGFPPHTISTDLHVRNIAGPVHDLATTLTKLLHCGMELERAVEAVTATPRRILRMDQPWLGDDGTIRHATIFRLADAAPPDRAYVDARGDTARPDRHVIPVATVREGVTTEL